MSDKLPKVITLETPTIRRAPKRIAAVVDYLYEIREQRIEYAKEIKKAEHVVSVFKEREEEIAKELAKELRAMGASKMSGQLATFSPGETDVFTVEDWEMFYSYIVQNDAFECLEKRPSRGALKERLVRDELPDGIKADKLFTFSLVKASRK